MKISCIVFKSSVDVISQFLVDLDGCKIYFRCHSCSTFLTWKEMNQLNDMWLCFEIIISCLLVFDHVVISSWGYCINLVNFHRNIFFCFLLFIPFRKKTDHCVNVLESIFGISLYVAINFVKALLTTVQYETFYYSLIGNVSNNFQAKEHKARVSH